MRRSRVPLAALAGGLILAGCDVPTEAPKVEQRWVIPVETTSIGVDEFLPSGVTVQGSNFQVDVDPFNTTEDLGTLCAACLANNLTTAPKPAFSETFTVEQNLPGDVTSVDVVSGSIAVTLSHNLGFDPIRPPGGQAGTLTLTVRNGPGGAAIGQLVLDGDTESFPDGTSLNRTIELSAATLGSAIQLEVSVDSPAGDAADPANWVPINTSNEIAASATPTAILISSATVEVSDQTVNLDPEEVDMEDIDSSITDHIQQGSVVLSIANPFGVSVNGSLTLGPVTKTLSIPGSATSEVSITYTGDELRQFIGQPGVLFSGSGSVSSSGPITVRPGQEITLEASIDLTILIG